MDIPINYLAILAAAIANMALGFLWFGPLFGKKWLALSGRSAESLDSEKSKGMAMTYVVQIVGALLMSYVLAHAIVFGTAYTGTVGIVGGLTAAFWYWLGFVAPVTVGDVLWNGRSWTFWSITAGYYLAAMLLMATTLSLWQ